MKIYLFYLTVFLNKNFSSSMRRTGRQMLPQESAENVKKIWVGKYNSFMPYRLLEYLETNVVDIKRMQLKRWLQYGHVVVNGEVQTKFDLPLHYGDSIKIISSPYLSQSSLGHLKVLFEDNTIVAMEKPHGNSADSIKIESKENVSSDSLKQFYLTKINSLLGKRKGGKERAYQLHSFEKDCSGVLLFAKSYETKKNLDAQWADTGKHYVALCSGIPPERSGSLISAVQPSQDLPSLTSSLPSTPNTHKSPVTVAYYQVVDSFTSPKTPGHNLGYSSSSYSKLSISLATSLCRDRDPSLRLRDELTRAGLPVLGDTDCVGNVSVPNPLRRLCLHLEEVRVIHPVTKRLLSIRCDEPPSFREFLEQCREEQYQYSRESSVIAAPVRPENRVPNDDSDMGAEQRSIKVLSLKDYLATSQSSASAHGGRKLNKR